MSDKRKLVRTWAVIRYLEDNYGFVINNDISTSLDEQLKEFLGLE